MTTKLEALLAFNGLAPDHVPTGKFVLRSIACRTDSTGKYRMSVAAVSPAIRTREEALTLVEVKRLDRIGFAYALEEVTPDEWRAAQSGDLNGYADACSLDAPRTIKRWTFA